LQKVERKRERERERKRYFIIYYFLHIRSLSKSNKY